MSSPKPHRIRVRVLDGKPRAWNKLKGQLGSHLDVLDAKDKTEFVICAVNEKQVAQVRNKLGAAGLEEIAGGDTNVSAPASPKPANVQPPRHGGPRHRGGPQHQQGPRESTPSNTQPLPGKPYGFVPLPKELTTAPPVWHDGTSTEGKLSGEIRFEIETLTPLLVGWERRQIDATDELWSVPHRPINANEVEAFVKKAARQVYPDATDADTERRQKKQEKVEEDRGKYVMRVQDHIVDVALSDAGLSIDSKSVLFPLRAPWGPRPVLLPGDSIKGLLRHELGALLGAPMERVAERSYSYRPNALYPLKPEGRFLVPRLARVPKDRVETKPLDGEHQVRVPTRLELFPAELEYNKKANKLDYRFDRNGGASYRGGQGAGQRLNSKPRVHTSLKVLREVQTEAADVPQAVQDGYLATLRHLVDLNHGHFSERHPDVPNAVTGDAARNRILKAAKDEVFQPGDLIWVEWDTDKKCIVSLGWHYYYRWAYMDSVRGRREGTRTRKEGGYERRGLFPLDEECVHDHEGAPKALSPVRRLLGYTGDNEGSAGIGKDDHAQLMGRVSVNAGLEVVVDGDTDDKRFLPPTFLKELGMPRPSAVEHYIQQPHHPKSRPSDRATLVTYGDAAGYDTPGELAGRKFYLDNSDAYTSEPWKDDSPANRANDRSTLALEASCRGRRFRFTVRFRDLDPSEVAAIAVALCPHHFRAVLGGDHTDGYCSKLGYARPLGWGSVRIEAKGLLLLDTASVEPALTAVPDVAAWVGEHHARTPMLPRWLAAHRHKHPDAADYPHAKDRDGNENIYTFHTTLRAEHTRARRYRPERSR